MNVVTWIADICLWIRATFERAKMCRYVEIYKSISNVYGRVEGSGKIFVCGLRFFFFFFFSHRRKELLLLILRIINYLLEEKYIISAIPFLIFIISHEIASCFKNQKNLFIVQTFYFILTKYNRNTCTKIFSIEQREY